MYKVLILSREGDCARNYLRQTPGWQGISADGRYQFLINEEIEDPDFLVVRGKAFREPRSFNVAPSNTILCTSEPPSVLRYPKGYCRQFGTVLTCQSSLNTGNNVYVPPVLPWLVGIEEWSGGNKINLSYDDFVKMPPSQPKKRLLSVISSNKTFTSGHRQRRRFVERLKERYGNQIDVFGAGINGFADKWETLAPYKYHIVIENSVNPLYWTEKLADCFLADTFPIYCGCPDVANYFPQDSFEPFSMNDFESACQLIDATIAANRYEESGNARSEARKLVLGKYNLFEIIAQACNKLKPDSPREHITIKPAQHYFNLHNFYVQTLSHAVGKLFWKLGF